MSGTVNFVLMSLDRPTRPIRLLLTDRTSVLPKPLFQSEAKCEAVDSSLCTDAPPLKKRKLGTRFFWWGGGGVGVCTQAN